jgi:hypothetical protein
MVQRWLSYLLISLVIAMPVLAGVDSHQLHQSESKHVEFNHDHKQLISQADAEAPSVSESDYDCHHCCHCHGSPPVFAFGIHNMAVVASMTDTLPTYPFKLHQISLVPDFPPPIA